MCLNSSKLFCTLRDTTWYNARIYNSRNCLILLERDHKDFAMSIYNSRNCLILLEVYIPTTNINIYNSRNCLILLEDDRELVILEIYNSRNCLILLEGCFSIFNNPVRLRSGIFMHVLSVLRMYKCFSIPFSL